MSAVQSCPTLCDPMDCGPSGSSVHGILQARILEKVAIPSSYFYGKPRLYIVYYKYFFIAFLVAQTERICLQYRRAGFDPLLGKIPRRRKWQPTLVFLPGELHGQRSLVGDNPWGHKESDITEQLTLYV